MKERLEEIGKLVNTILKAQIKHFLYNNKLYAPPLAQHGIQISVAFVEYELNINMYLFLAIPRWR